VKVGDLIKVSSSTCTVEDLPADCGCWFCCNNSSRMGVVLKKLSEGMGNSYWSILFDAGAWRLYGDEFEVISESG